MQNFHAEGLVIDALDTIENGAGHEAYPPEQQALTIGALAVPPQPPHFAQKSEGGGSKRSGRGYDEALAAMKEEDARKARARGEPGTGDNKRPDQK